MPEYLAQVLEFQLFTLAGTPVTLGTLVTALIILLVAYAISRVMQRSSVRLMNRQGLMRDAGTQAAVRRLLHYVVMLVGLGIALDTIGIDLGALFAAGAFFAVAIGFAMQNIAQNFVSGVILLMERSIKPGDILDVNGTVVRVSELRIRATLARTRDDEELIIPNSVLVQSTVKNYTLRDSVYRVRASVGVHYGSDLKLVFETLQHVAARQTWRTQDQDPRVLLLGFGNSSVDFEVSVWIDNPWDARVYLSQLNDALWWALKDAGITIAFPQLDVHFDDGVSVPARARGEGSRTSA